MPDEGAGGTGTLVGRDADLERVLRLLSRHRLVTLTGPGGVGKTRLARAAVARLAEGAAPRRAVFCTLAEVDEPAAVREAVAAHLGLSRADRPLRWPMPPGDGVVVLLDNCEHLVGAAAEVAGELLAAGPRIAVLATSREALRLDEERVFEVSPLPVPGRGHDPRAAESPAVRLFTERARAVRDGFALDGAVLPYVSEICRRLDGLPLALEIAAARVRSMGVADLAGRLEERFALLHSGSRGGSARHRSLRAVVEWSYRLLGPAERTLFDALTVFPAGADLTAVTEVAGAAGLGPDEAVDAVDGLCAKSLVQLDTSVEPPRYRILETLRQYGTERLRDAGTLDAARDRHASIYAAVCMSIRAEGMRVWSPRLLRLFAEFDNVRAAVSWALTADASPDRAFRLLATQWYVGLNLHSSELADLCERAVRRWPGADHPLLSEVHASAAISLIAIDEVARAGAHAQVAIDAATSPVGVALGRRALGEVRDLRGDWRGGLEQLDLALDSAAAAGFEPLRCDLLGIGVPMLAQGGRHAEATARARTSLELAAAQHNVYEHAWALMLLGSLCLQTSLDEAEGWLTTALEESRATGYPTGTRHSLRALGVLAQRRGRAAEAAGHFVEALDLAAGGGQTQERWTCVAAALPSLAARPEVAVAAAVHLGRVDGVIAQIWAPGWEETREAVLAGAPADTVARARALAPERVLAMVRAALTEPATPATPPPAPEIGDAELRRDGDLWRITYGGQTVHLPALRGLDDLATLLANPGREIPALDLAAGPGGRPDGAAAEGDLGELIDAPARAAYARRIRELRADLDDADAAGDAERSASATAELDTLTQHLASAYGLRGARRAGDPGERARAAVTGRIRAAIRKIAEVHEPLGRHFDRGVRTGRLCVYDPEAPVRWQVRPSPVRRGLTPPR
ncbi:hypothetical protein Ade02nite_63620 [Paractinoplanes deccanensis]|uniref:ATPase n=1 Tax=Paractinoplanes deccanensis TaxID=113561 RepID=A0ABQ3YCH4_9ACTN|nr:hypothetical protein [Actinoplanes deccanensis]GID77721.1 hypothetical protein Ade02nite_63620 [Actinoplanes deccanensis]